MTADAMISQHARSIRDRIAALKVRRNELQLAADHIQLDIASVARDCHHENKTIHHDYAGDTDEHCLDCGKLF